MTTTTSTRTVHVHRVREPRAGFFNRILERFS